MLERQSVWKSLGNETKSFVLDYLKSNLKLSDSDVEGFLFPSYKDSLLDGRAMHDMDKAVQRIVTALLKKERICVYGDYDCDGVPGTALLRDFFEKINYHNVIYYIPHRHTEGYGLNKTAIEKIFHGDVEKELESGELIVDAESETMEESEKHIRNKTRLMITIDLGTTNIEEVDYANQLGVDVIITDHHLPIENEDGQVLPKAFAIINNKKNNCHYANKDLCGSGTIFKLVVETIYELNSIFTNEKNLWNTLEKNGIKLPQNGYEKWLLDLVAIATIADMVPLTYENRTLAIYGMHVLKKTNRAGLQTIFQNAKTDLRKVTETDIAFTIAPRINSASRMAHPKIALSMFSQNLKEGIDAAHTLEELNKNRKEMTTSISKKIYKILDARIANSPEKKLPEILVIGDSEWNAGILGILASKILDKYNVNVFVYGGNESGEKVFKGSCRSRGDIHLVKLMTEIKNKFNHFGGHELAGGFSVTFENIHDLEIELNKNIEKARIQNLVQEKKENSLLNFIEIGLEKVTSELLDALSLIGPFGVGNPKPYFKIINILSHEVVRFGKNKEHLKINLVGKNNNDKITKIEAIKFFVEKSDEDKIVEDFKKQNLFFEIEAGWMSKNPRLKIVS